MSGCGAEAHLRRELGPGRRLPIETNPVLIARVRAMQQPMQEIPTETTGGWRGYWVGIHIDPATKQSEEKRDPANETIRETTAAAAPAVS